MTAVFLIVLGLICGLIGVLGSGAIDGLGKAMFGVFLILAFISRMIEKADSTK